MSKIISQIAKEVLEDYWPTETGVLPGDTPACGYDGGLCDNTKLYAGAGALVIILISIPLGYFLYVKE